MAKTYVWASDAGHEWLSVKRAELVRLGIADQISGYSYVKGSTVYLEGDSDASLFIRAKETAGESMTTRAGKVWDKSPIRRFEAYRPTGVRSEFAAQIAVPTETSFSEAVAHTE